MPYKHPVIGALIFWMIFSAVPLLSQNYHAKGYVTATDSGEPLVGVVVMDTLSGRATVTDGYGFYSLPLPDGYACLRLQYPGYAELLSCGGFGTEAQRDLHLMRLAQIATVEVRARQSGGGADYLQGGVVGLPLELLREMPQLGGEADLLKTLALLPGMSLGVEGTSGLFIRGGTPDQNLVLVDDAPVYNLSHFGPLLSVFNMDAVKHVRVMKGNWPVPYGGRLSGLVDIHTKEGDMGRWAGQVAASPLLGRFLVEGPLKKDRTAVLLSARSSWLGGLMRLAQDDRMSQQYLMYDLNAKISHRFGRRHRLYLSFYSSMDDSRLREEVPEGGFGGASPLVSSRGDTGIRWGNRTASARYSTYFGGGWALQGILYHTRYRYTGYRDEMEKLRSGVVLERYQANVSANQDVGAKLLLSHHATHTRLDVGAEQVVQSFSPQSTFVASTDTVALSTRSQAWMQAYFAGLTLWPDGVWSANLGFRQVFFRTGGTVYTSPEPRLSLRWRPSPSWTVKAGGGWGSQFLHLLTTGNVGLTNEVWVGSTALVPPQRGGQASGGVAWRHGPTGVEVEAEVFARRMTGLIEFRPIGDEELFKLSDWEGLVETGGYGRVEGLELLVRRGAGRFSGWVAYTLSRNIRRFSQINGGEWFPFRFDRRHDIALVGQCQVNRHWRLSATWVYQTGVAITLPVAQIPRGATGGGFEPFGGVPSSPVITRRNNARMPPHHRLDVAATRQWEGRRPGQSHTLGISVYNAYNRINPYFINVESRPIIGPDGQYMGSTEPKVTVVGLFPIIPAVSYAFAFGGRPAQG